MTDESWAWRASSAFRFGAPTATGGWTFRALPRWTVGRSCPRTKRPAPRPQKWLRTEELSDLKNERRRRRKRKHGSLQLHPAIDLPAVPAQVQVSLPRGLERARRQGQPGLWPDLPDGRRVPVPD